MEIMRKRSYHLCDKSVYDDSGSVHNKRHMVELNLMHSGQKRVCNGVSSYLLQQVDQTSECTGISVGGNAFSSSIRNAPVAMETMHAPSCHPADSMQSSCYVMTAGGDATSATLSQHFENQQSKVCQRCLSGESGHITHILS